MDPIRNTALASVLVSRITRRLSFSRRSAWMVTGLMTSRISNESGATQKRFKRQREEIWKPSPPRCSFTTAFKFRRIHSCAQRRHGSQPQKPGPPWRPSTGPALVSISSPRQLKPTATRAALPPHPSKAEFFKMLTALMRSDSPALLVASIRPVAWAHRFTIPVTQWRRTAPSKSMWVLHTPARITLERFP
jgi:hypothetical protein